MNQHPVSTSDTTISLNVNGENNDDDAHKCNAGTGSTEIGDEVGTALVNGRVEHCVVDDFVRQVGGKRSIKKVILLCSIFEGRLC